MSAKNKKRTAEPVRAIKKQKHFSKEEYKYLSIIVLAGIILRLVYVIETQGTPFFQNLFSDSKIYFDLASNIASGNWIGDQIYFMSPGYPYFLAVIFIFFGKSILAVRLIQIFLNGINIIIIYLIGRNLHSEKAGYFSAGIAAVYSPFIFYSGAILLEVVQTFVISLFLLLITGREFLTRNRSWFWAGLLLGIASLLRANILLLFPVMLLWLLIKVIKKNSGRNFYFRSVLYFTIGCFVPVLIVTARNYLVGNDFVLISSNGGINFYLGNNDNAPGIYKTPEDFDFFNDLSGRKYAERLTGKNLSPSESSYFWFRESFKFIEQNPLSWLKLTGEKFLYFFDNNEYPQSAIMDPSFFAGNYSTVLKLPLPGFFIVFLISIFGFSLTWRRRREYALIYVFLFTYLAATILFFIIGRFRVAVSPVFIVFAGIGVTEGYQIIKVKSIKTLFAPVLIALLFIFSVVTILPDYNFSDYDAYINLGNLYFGKHQYDEALLNFEKATSLKADASSYVLLGNTYAAKKNFKRALELYYKAINNNPDYYLAYFNMGIAYTQNGNLDEAERYFSKTIELNPAFDDAYRNLAIIDYIKGDYKTSLLNFEKFMSLTDDVRAKETVRQDIQELKRRIKREQN